MATLGSWWADGGHCGCKRWAGVAAVAINAAGTCCSHQHWGWVVPAAVVNDGARGCHNCQRWDWGLSLSQLSMLGLGDVTAVNTEAGAWLPWSSTLVIAGDSEYRSHQRWSCKERMK